MKREYKELAKAAQKAKLNAYSPFSKFRVGAANLGILTLKTTAKLAEQNQPVIPEDFALRQNYPNPFNPTTTIAFDIPKDNFVSLKVNNSLGQEITELAGREYSAGQHSVTFNALNLTSGIYYYAMKAGDFTMVQKMSLLK
jgi:hypothetical protein